MNFWSDIREKYNINKADTESDTYIEPESKNANKLKDIAKKNANKELEQKTRIQYEIIKDDLCLYISTKLLNKDNCKDYYKYITDRIIYNNYKDMLDINILKKTFNKYIDFYKRYLIEYIKLQKLGINDATYTFLIEISDDISCATWYREDDRHEEVTCKKINKAIKYLLKNAHGYHSDINNSDDSDSE